MATKRTRIVDGVPQLWMICRDPQGTNRSEVPNPKYLYTSEVDARKDAAEMCRQQQRPFYLLKVVDVVEPQAPPVAWKTDV